MNDTLITLVGNVVDEPRLRRTGNGNDVTNFRIASTSRRYDREQGRFVDHATTFLTVTCWRQFGVNVHQSLRKGQPVVVTGRFAMREYKVDEQIRTAYELEAVSVGHDLARGTSQFARVIPTNAVVTVDRDEDGLPTDESDRWLGVVDATPEDTMDGATDGAIGGAVTSVTADVRELANVG